MTNKQLTLAQVDDYGPWAVNAGPWREADLQMLQARQFADLAQIARCHDGCTFFARLDSMVAVTTGIEVESRAGSGQGPTVWNAGRPATRTLEECRQNDSRIGSSAFVRAGIEQ